MTFGPSDDKLYREQDRHLNSHSYVMSLYLPYVKFHCLYSHVFLLVLLSVFRSPLPGCRNRGLLVLLPALGNIGGERVIRVRGTEKGLDREEDGSDL